MAYGLWLIAMRVCGKRALPLAGGSLLPKLLRLLKQLMIPLGNRLKGLFKSLWIS